VACARPQPVNPSDSVRPYPFIDQVDRGLNLIQSSYAGSAKVNGDQIVADFLTRIERAYPGLVAAVPAPGGGWVLGDRTGRRTIISPGTGLSELRGRLFAILDATYLALGPTWNGDLRLAPERLALAALFCQLDTRSALLPPMEAADNALLSPSMRGRLVGAARAEANPSAGVLCASKGKADDTTRSAEGGAGRDLVGAADDVEPIGPLSGGDVLWKGVDHGLLYLRAVEFNRGAALRLADVLERANEANGGPPAGLVVNLLDVGDGLPEEARAVADLFLPAGDAFVTVRGAASSPEISRTTTDGHERTLPVVLLVDGTTSGPATLLAGLLQEHGRALVMGAEAPSDATIQQLFPLEPLLGAVLLTVGRVGVAGNAGFAGVVPQVRWPPDPAATASQRPMGLGRAGQVPALLSCARAVIRTTGSADPEGLRLAFVRLAAVPGLGGPCQTSTGEQNGVVPSDPAPERSSGPLGAPDRRELPLKF